MNSFRSSFNRISKSKNIIGDSKRAIEKLIANKYVAYFILFIAITNVLGYLVTRKINSVILFMLVGGLTWQTSKNTILAALVATIVTNIFVVNGRMREGMETETNTDTTSGSTKTKDDVIDKVNTKNPDAVEKAEAYKEDGTTPVIDVMNPDMNKSPDDLEKNIPEGVGTRVNAKIQSKSKTESFNGGNKLTGSPLETATNARIDYASTMESAYDNLDKILGSDSIGKLTNDTQKLMTKQQQLFDTMQTMVPALEQAKTLLGGFDLKNLGDIGNLGKSLA